MKWNLEKRKLSELHETEINPRRLSQEDAKQLEESIKKFGICSPIVINQDGMIIGGHQRVRILKKLKQKEVDVYAPDVFLDKKETEELNIRLNKNQGEFDFDILANCCDPVDLVEWGFTPDELHIDLGDSKKNKDDKKVFSIVVSFIDFESLEKGEKKIEDAIFEIHGSSYKVKVK